MFKSAYAVTTNMNAILTWIKSHTWETVSAVLGIALVVALGFLATDSGEEFPEVAADTTTTTSTSPDPVPAETTVPDEADEPVSTTEPPPEDNPPSITAVVVDNHPSARPQIGIGAADLIVETPVEGGLTRFTALFGGQPPDLVGPVRSLRPVSADLLAPFQPVVFTTGGQPFVTGAVSGAGVTVVTQADSVGFQSLERPQPHHLFASPSVDVSEGVQFPWPWQAGEWPGGEPVTEISLPIAGGVEWRFEDDVYVRYQEGEPYQALPAVDAEPEPLTRDTVVVLVANQKSAGYTDSTGADVPTFDIVGEGGLYVLHGGELVEGSWSRASQAEGYEFIDQGGESVTVPEGSVYWAIVPDDQPLDLGP
ncbi:MAG: DUF3048 domain-containing protein [Actinomycetota bacterium]